MNLERERELFLEWLKKEYPTMHQWYLDGDDDWKTEVDYMFVAWLASASRDGYKLVPVENIDTIKIACENVIEIDNIDIYRGLAKTIIDDCKDMLGAVE